MDNPHSHKHIHSCTHKNCTSSEHSHAFGDCYCRSKSTIVRMISCDELDSTILHHLHLEHVSNASFLTHTHTHTYTHAHTHTHTHAHTCTHTHTHTHTCTHTHTHAHMHTVRKK